MSKLDGLAGKVIIIIDDSGLTSDIADYLENTGAVVRFNHSGSVFRDQEEIPSLILLNYHLKAKNSCELCIHLKKETKTRNIPLIFFGSAMDTNQKSEVYRCGADDILLTPFSFEEVLTKARTYIELSQKRVEQITIRESLKKNEERLKSLFNNSPNAIAIYQSVDEGHDFIFTDFNLTAEETEHIERDQVIGKRISELFPAARGLGFLEAFRRVWQTGNTEHLESSYYNDNRIDGWRENIIYRLTTGEVVSIYSDTTARMKAEIALRESEEKFRRLFENHSAIKLLIDPENQKIVHANKAAAKFYGWTLDELKKMRIQEINMMSSADIVETMGKAMTKDKAQFEFRHRLKNGKIKDVEVFSSKTVIGGKVYLHAIVHDIHNRKKAESALVEMNALNELLLKTIPFGIDIVDESGTILFMNENLERQVGYNALGNTCWSVYRDNKEHCQDCPLFKGIRIGETDVYETDGVLGEKIFQISHTGMIYKGKKALLEIFQDVSERKHGEKELIKAKEKAEKSDRLKTAFLHNISHEIRTPMNAIIGFAGLLNDPDLLPESRKEFTDVIMQSSQQLLSIITDIINIAAIETDQGKIFNQKFRLNLTMKFLFATFVSRAQCKNLSLSFEVDLPDTDDMVSCDKSKLESILSNLIGNALKFTRVGGVSFGYTIKENWIEFYVSDSGIGISPDMHQEIFDYFRQVEISEKRAFGGTGLGLSISKAYVELMGGRIWLTSALGEGSTFYFSIPYRKVAAVSILNEVSLNKISSDQPVILIAEDEDSNFILLEALLAKFSIRIVRAYNGRDAVEKYRSDPYISLILMDIKMPEMDGLEATREIKILNPQVPIVAQSAYAFPEQKEEALKAGCDAFLSKPFKTEELYKIVNEILK